MKKITLQLVLVLASFLVSSASFAAEKVVITGQPIMLEARDNVYYLPQDYQYVQTDYYYATVDNMPRVCYLQPNTSLTGVNMMDIKVMVNNTQQTWHCYDYSEDYFTVTR